MRGTPIDELQELLRKAGLRATQPRISVLRYLQKATSPISHGEVAEELAREGLDRATVYRNLIDLSDAGLVRRTDLGDHVWRFELIGAGGHPDEKHPHFVCESCGTVACLPEDVVTIHPRSGMRALRRKGLSVHVRGVCDGCA